MAYAKTLDTGVAIRSTQPDESWVEVTNLPEDKLLRDAYTLAGGAVVTDLPKAKDIAHEERRAIRAEKFKAVDGGSPYVAVSAEGEVKRKAIKDPDDAMQVAIDASVDEAALREVLNASA